MESAVVFDDTLYALIEAQHYLDQWVEVDPYKLIYEADDPEVQNQVNNNKIVEQNTDGALIKVVKSIQALIKRAVDSIKSFLSQMTMSKEKRNAFNEFKEACKKDPALANKKITVTDFDKLSKQYDDYIAQVEHGIREEAAGRVFPAQQLTQNVTGFLSNAGKHIGTTMTASVAEKMAASKPYIARQIASQLDEEGAVMRQLEETMGKKGAKNYKKHMESMGRRFSLHRMKVKLLHGKSQCMIDAVKDTTNELSNLMSGKVRPNNIGMGVNVLKTPEGKKVVKATATAAKDARMDHIKDKFTHPMNRRRNRIISREKQEAIGYIFGKPKKKK